MFLYLTVYVLLSAEIRLLLCCKTGNESHNGTASATPDNVPSSLCALNDTYHFECSKRGNFSNSVDLSCGSYYLCEEGDGGDIVGTLHTCPAGSYYDPRIGICSTSHQCPCSLPDNNEDLLETDLVETCVIEDDPDYFECTSNGKFPNRNDPTCRSYFVCIKLILTGKFIKTKHTCPLFMSFDPILRICRLTYKCVCTLPTTTTESTTEVTKTESTTAVTKTESTTEVTKTESTTEVTTTEKATTIETCVVEENPDYLVCTEKGRFPNLNDPTCQSYFLCERLFLIGKYVKSKHSCPIKTYFDPDVEICSATYECPCASTITSTTEITTTAGVSCVIEDDPDYFQCTTKGKFPNLNDPKCESYFLCSKLLFTYIKTLYYCPLRSYFDPDEKICTDSYECPCSQVTSTTPQVTSSTSDTTERAITTVTTCDYEEDPDYFVCTIKGRFPNKNDLTCQSYFLCSQKGSGAFVKTKYTCPTNSYFDPSLGVCSLDYTCSCNEEISTTQIYATSTASSSEHTTTETPSTTITTDATPTQASSSTTTTTQVITTTAACDYEEEPDYFVCTVKGRFPNKNDPTCQSYFLCSQKGSGAFVKTKYSCPTSSNFDPSLGACSLEYTCPCTEETSTTDTYATSTASSSESTTTESPSTSITTDATPTQSSSSTITTTQGTTTTAVCDFEEDPDYFVCTVKGRFPNKNDLTCQSYFLCSQKGSGAFVKTKYSCPTNSYFDPSLVVCSLDYTCSCNEEISTSESYATSTASSSEHTSTTEISSSTITTTQASTTTAACDYNDDPDYFVCTAKGKFPNKNDLTCQSYFLCSLKGSGAYVKTKYTCPTTSYFDPTLGVCTVEYTCPCSEETSTTETYATSTASSSEHTTIDAPSTSISTDATPTETSSSAITTTQVTTTTAACDYNDDPDYFVCTAKGKFPNNNDLTCQSYFLCSLKGSGAYVKTKYTCPTTSYFDPTLAVCTVEYTCPCSEETSTTETYSTSTAWSSESTTTESPSTSITTDATTTETSSSTITTTQASTTTPACDYNDDPDYFVCTAKGKFPNKNDLTCHSYFLCSIKGSGAFVKTKYSCPTNSYFDPTLGVCTVEYTCPCSEETSITETYATSTASSSESTTTESLSTSITTDATPTQTSSSTITTTQGSTTTAVCDFEEDPDYLICTAKGKFPNKNDLTCQSYFLCSLKGSGAYVKTKYTCPTNSYFDPTLAVCTVEYTCPCSEETSTTETYATSTAWSSESTTTESPSTSITTDATPTHTSSSTITTTQGTTTTAVCDFEEDPDYFVCTVKGRFPNKNDLTCQSYFLCSQKGSGAFVKTKYSCPTNSYFDPSLGVCSLDYTCSCNEEISTSESYATSTASSSEHTSATETSSSTITTTQASTTTPACDYNDDPDYFVCTAKGKFPNKNDLTCQSYFLCSLKGSGAYVKTKYTCPTTSYFDPTLAVCTVEYTCPCSEETSTTETYATSTAWSSESTTTESPSTSITTDATTTETSPSTITTTQASTTTATCDYNDDPDYFVCTAKGKFPNKNDLTCQSYFLCSQKGSGAFVKTKYSCPTNSYFDPSLGVCSLDYTCSCNEEISTTESYATSTASSSESTTTESPSTSITTDATTTETSSSTITTTQVTTTTAACDFEEDPDYLICTAKGRFVNKNDLTCQSYFLCSQKGSGAFVKTKYSCPTNSYFDPSLGVCSLEYTCPCNEQSSTTESYTTSTASSSEHTTESPSNSITTDATPTETGSSAITTTQVTTTTAACDYNDDPDYFDCTVKGRFPNKNDLTCQSYFLCSLKGSGAFVKTKYSCPTTSYFDPSVGVCTVEYTCPCTEETSTTESYTTSTASNSEHTTDGPSTSISTDATPTETSSSTITTTQVITTTAACEYEEDPDYLVCTTKGRFVNKNDLTCQSYFLCSLKGSGAFVKTKYTCPTTSYFDPTLGVCTAEYTCPCNKETSTTESYTTSTASSYEYTTESPYLQ